MHLKYIKKRNLVKAMRLINVNKCNVTKEEAFDMQEESSLKRKMVQEIPRVVYNKIFLIIFRLFVSISLNGLKIIFFCSFFCLQGNIESIKKYEFEHSQEAL